MTERQQQILDYVRDYFARHGRSPSQRKIASDLGIKGLSTVNAALQALEAYGFLERNAEYSGRYVPVGIEHTVLSTIATDTLRDELARRDALEREAGQ